MQDKTCVGCGLSFAPNSWQQVKCNGCRFGPVIKKRVRRSARQLEEAAEAKAKSKAPPKAEQSAWLMDFAISQLPLRYRGKKILTAPTADVRTRCKAAEGTIEHCPSHGHLSEAVGLRREG